MVFVVAEKKFGFVSQILKKLREPFHRIGLVGERKSGGSKHHRVVYR
jgi:hypothetical protein